MPAGPAWVSFSPVIARKGTRIRLRSARGSQAGCPPPLGVGPAAADAGDVGRGGWPGQLFRHHPAQHRQQRAEQGRRRGEPAALPPHGRLPNGRTRPAGPPPRRGAGDRPHRVHRAFGTGRRPGGCAPRASAERHATETCVPPEVSASFGQLSCLRRRVGRETVAGVRRGRRLRCGPAAGTAPVPPARQPTRGRPARARHAGGRGSSRSSRPR